MRLFVSLESWKFVKYILYLLCRAYDAIKATHDFESTKLSYSKTFVFLKGIIEQHLPRLCSLRLTRIPIMQCLERIPINVLNVPFWSLSRPTKRLSFSFGHILRVVLLMFEVAHLASTKSLTSGSQMWHASFLYLFIYK